MRRKTVSQLKVLIIDRSALNVVGYGRESRKIVALGGVEGRIIF